jgi:3-deoxy-manno-octulosonate cytidylyltransferase (CMP-KDO synthetase)
MKTAIIIPARYGSSRFPGKPLYPVLGVSLIERVWRIAKAIDRPTTIIVATENQRVYEVVKGFGGQAVMTSENCTNGTERTAEALIQANIKPDIIINLQGDAILTPPWVLESMIDVMNADPNAEIVTPAVRLEGSELSEFIKLKKVTPSSGTTVVFDKEHYALYFSKNILPYVRNAGHSNIHRHIGLYAFRMNSLINYTSLPQTPLEMTEGLEQLRALENGIKIKVAIVDYRGRSHGSIDSPDDVNFIENIILREGELVAGF